MPLRITRVDEEPRIPQIRSRYLGPKPLFCKISKRMAQETESNALEISALKESKAVSVGKGTRLFVGQG
jgi:hypothetical protein